MSLRLQPVRVSTDSDDGDGHLVFENDGLVAVLVHLSEAHGEAAGMWFLEAGFGRVGAAGQRPSFRDLDEAQDWIAGRLAKA
ncbi:MAG TPA: hypothetical protein VF641_07275 [Methylobacterium sp.]|jgi:hypothetical protein